MINDIIQRLNYSILLINFNATYAVNYVRFLLSRSAYDHEDEMRENKGKVQNYHALNKAFHFTIWLIDFFKE